MAPGTWLLSRLLQRLVRVPQNNNPSRSNHEDLLIPPFLRGPTFAFGLFQNYYETVLLADMNPSAISWVGTTGSYLLIVTGVISGPLFDLGFYRVMLIGGAAVSTFGCMMLSLSTKYYQILLSQGICMGLGCGVLYVPGLALVSRSFTTRRALALGIVTCGAPIGGIIYTIVFNQLIDEIGFDWTVRVMGFIMFTSFSIAFPLLLWGTVNTGDIAAGTTRKIFDKNAFSDLGFWLYTWSNFFVSSERYGPLQSQNEQG